MTFHPRPQAQASDLPFVFNSAEGPDTQSSAPTRLEDTFIESTILSPAWARVEPGVECEMLADESQVENRLTASYKL